ncbi:hypothetical protein FQN60_014287 [Etheostoma spectabile]|uniref:Transporter n=1 Tax=Etheostoma spectabile TaxID=54343 RepID=A0A5J5DB64_9PERO|nr:hypothetical protein FQN60_014287 [Etheostoma spectabile]
MAGAYLVPYLILLILIGIPLFFLELAVGQRIRRGSIGVWNYISPRLGGIGFASCVVCFFVALYYNVIISWSLFYFSQSFQQPLPWHECPLIKNKTSTHVVPECEKSSATTYYWYREALDISDNISVGGGLNWKMTVCLLVAWSIVCLAMIKGIQSSGKVMYFSSLFPYVVLICFLVRALLLKGSVDGIRHMFTPKAGSSAATGQWHLRLWNHVTMETGVTEALCNQPAGDACSQQQRLSVSCVCSVSLGDILRLQTALPATVFSVQYLRTSESCCVGVLRPLNTNKIVSLLGNGIEPSLIPHHINLTHVSAEDYQQMIDIIKGPYLLSPQQAVQGTGLAFIAFTEAMTHFPASPFWSVMFFLMLVNLGLGSMFGTIEGILTPLVDTFKVRKEFLTGNYYVTMFDDYSATLPLLIVVVLENVAIAWVYGIDKFFEDLKDMLGFTPYRFYYYMWKYITPILLLVLLCASFIQLSMTPPSYSAWIQEEAKEQTLHFPPWGIVVCISLVVMAIMPVPVVFGLRYFNIIDDGTSGLSTVAYKKGRIIKETARPGEDDDTSLIQGKSPSEQPSPMPGNSIYRKQSGSGGADADTAPNGRYGIGYLMADIPDMPESDL